MAVARLYYKRAAGTRQISCNFLQNVDSATVKEKAYWISNKVRFRIGEI